MFQAHHLDRARDAHGDVTERGIAFGRGTGQALSGKAHPRAVIVADGNEYIAGRRVKRHGNARIGQRIHNICLVGFRQRRVQRRARGFAHVEIGGQPQHHRKRRDDHGHGALKARLRRD